MIIAGLMVLAMIATFTISPAMLTGWKIHYLTTGWQCAGEVSSGDLLRPARLLSADRS